MRLMVDQLKSPYAIYEFFRNILSESCLQFTYTLNKKQFKELMSKYMKTDTDNLDLNQIFKIFQREPP